MFVFIFTPSPFQGAALNCEKLEINHRLIFALKWKFSGTFAHVTKGQSSLKTSIDRSSSLQYFVCLFETSLSLSVFAFILEYQMHN